MIKKTVIFTVVVLILMQFVSVEKSNPEIDETLALKTSQNVMEVLKKGCYDCHSNETKWPYYSNIAPISFVVSSHVKKGRAALNFSQWLEIDSKIKKERLKRAIVTVNNGRMALPSYLWAHEDSRLSKDEKKVLTDWFKDELESNLIGVDNL